MTRVFVVDSCVGRAAGGENAEFPTSKHARDFLSLLRDCRHKVAFDPTGFDEWKRHCSLRAKKWLTEMHARRLVIQLDEETSAQILIPLAALESVEEHHRSAVEKDAHVVATALAHDRLLASLDDRLLTALLHLCSDLTCVRGLVWIDVDRHGDDLVAWVQAGAHHGYASPPSAVTIVP